MPLKVRHKRLKGDHRLVDLSGTTDFKITYTGDSRLRLRFRDHIKGAKWQAGFYDSHDRSKSVDTINGMQEEFDVIYDIAMRRAYGFYLLPITKENATAILKFGIENDFTFSPRALKLMSELPKSA